MSLPSCFFAFLSSFSQRKSLSAVDKAGHRSDPLAYPALFSITFISRFNDREKQAADLYVAGTFSSLLKLCFIFFSSFLSLSLVLVSSCSVPTLFSRYCNTQHLHLGFFFNVMISTCDASPGPCAVILATSTVLDAEPTFSLAGS